MQISAGWRERRMLCRVVIACAMVFSGCTQVGPDFIRPEPPVMQQWMEADEAQVRTSPADYRMWWTAFRDPVLDHLVQIAYAQNIPLHVAGARVFEARARLSIGFLASDVGRFGLGDIAAGAAVTAPSVPRSPGTF